MARRAAKLIADNSPVILTAVGVTGALTTAYLTGRASFKAALILEEEQRKNLYPLAHNEDRPFRPLLAKEKVRLCWKLYIPAAVTGTLTVAAIVGADRIGTRRAAALAAAYAISDKAFEEYKAKVVEKLGEKKEEAVRDSIAQDRVNNIPVGGREVIVTGNGSVLCMDAFSGRYFLSDMESLRKAENDINWAVVHNNYATLSDFYEIIGLPETSISSEVGWNVDKMMDMHFSSALTEATGKPCMVVTYTTVPIRGFHRMQ